MSINTRIRQARERKNLNQSELARIIGVKPQTVQQWESGETAPRRARYKQLCDALGVTPEWLQTGYYFELSSNDRVCEPTAMFDVSEEAAYSERDEWLSIIGKLTPEQKRVMKDALYALAKSNADIKR